MGARLGESSSLKEGGSGEKSGSGEEGGSLEKNGAIKKNGTTKKNGLVKKKAISGEFVLPAHVLAVDGGGRSKGGVTGRGFYLLLSQ